MWPDVIHEQSSGNRDSMFQETRYFLRSGEDRGFPCLGDFAGVAQRAGSSARVLILASVSLLSPCFLFFPGKTC